MRLPPLNSLKAFEAAARHLSFTRAAEELFVTSGAVSQQIKQLEEAMGVKLFERAHRKIYLTEFGQALLPGLSDGFERLLDAVNAVENMSSNKPVTISAAPSFASKWLVPRLGRFHDLYPGIDSRIDTTPQLVDLTRGDIDLGIRYGAGHYPGLVSHHLMTQEVFPVCSPGLLEGEHPIKEPTDLKHHQLLHYDLPEVDLGWPDWQMWLLAAGVKDVDYRRGLRLAQSDLLAQAVLDGQGVALLGSVSVKDNLVDGRLVRPFDLSFCPKFSFYLCYAKSKQEQLNVMKFKDWLLDEIKR